MGKEITQVQMLLDLVIGSKGVGLLLGLMKSWAVSAGLKPACLLLEPIVGLGSVGLEHGTGLPD